MEFSVSEVRQTACGYLARYRAEVEIAPGDGAAVVEVVSTRPEDATPILLEQTIEQIRLGAESVLRPRSLQAHIRLHGLVIHDVDCWPEKYGSVTAEALAAALDARMGS